MAWAIFATFFSFDVGFVRISWESITRPEAPYYFRVLGIVTIVMLVGAIVLSLHRGLKMWRADSWETGHRTIGGVELKFEAAVVLGLGMTVFFFVARGIY